MESTAWRFLDTGKGSAFFNMAMDEAIVEEMRKGNSPPTFRVYEWEPEGITVGYNQKALEVLDHERCLKDGTSVTRRLTGGRAVFHAREIAYSVIGHIPDPHFGSDLRASYEAIGVILLKALLALGVEADWRKGNICGREEKGISRFAPCFLSTSQFEITCRERKMVGSAQRRFRDVFLQQGSILTGRGHEQIVEYMKESDNKKDIFNLINRKSIDIETALCHPVDTVSLKASLYESFSQAVCGSINKEEASSRELEYTRCSMNERYSSKGWVWGYG